MTHCADCGHVRTAHVQPRGDCRACPRDQPCEGWSPIDDEDDET